MKQAGGAGLERRRLAPFSTRTSLPSVSDFTKVMCGLPTVPRNPSSVTTGQTWLPICSGVESSSDEFPNKRDIRRMPFP